MAVNISATHEEERRLMPLFNDKRKIIHQQKDNNSSVYTFIFNPEESIYLRRDAIKEYYDNLNDSIVEMEQQVEDSKKEKEAPKITKKPVLKKKKK